MYLPLSIVMKRRTVSSGNFPKPVDMRRSLPVFIALFSILSVYAQQPQRIKVKDPVICYAGTKDHLHYIKPPQQYLDRLQNQSARTNATTIEVTYVGFENNAEARQSFQTAIDIWASIINTSVPIRIEARWTTLGSGVLGSAGYTYAYANFKGAQKLDVYYPVAIAEKITGRELNDGEADIIANFNSSFDWHYDPSTTPASGKYDLTTVVLHEIGHGLGFSGTMTVSSGKGSYGLSGTDIPVIYDIPIENGSGANVIEGNFTAEDLASIFTSQNLFFDAPSGHSELYAPATFNSGSSISHLDETTYNGTENSLMTPQIASKEQMLHPGIALEMLADLGWETIVIEHNQLTDSENQDGPYTVTATIKADSGYNDASVTLHYSTDGSPFTDVTMAPAGEVNAFSANIPGDGNEHTFQYYISVENTESVAYFNPGKIVTPKSTQTQSVYTFSVGPDNEAPIIKHTAEGFVLDSETELTIQATISDNSGQITATLQYLINDIEQPDATLVLIDPKEDSVYSYTLDVSSLSNGDVLKYRIVAVDHSSNANQSVSPESDYYTVNTVGLEPTQDSYVNDFNSASDDFFGTGFSITTPSGFTDGAIHSDHPYEEGQGQSGNEINLTYQLKIPIRVKETDALIKFEEIVLVEPGESGSEFGDDDFYDYVVVEGSTDGGITWTPVADGYDARANSAWLSRYNSATSGNNSTATGDPSLYKSRTLDLQTVFDTNDEVVIRFRLYSDELAAGWGWAVDNLKIQIDETSPVILHDHFDFITEGTQQITLTSSVSDASGVSEYALEVYVNDAEPETVDIPVDDLFSQYDFTLNDLDQLSDGDVIHYRFVAEDVNGNVSTFPTDGFIEVTVLEFGDPISEYVNNFNSATTDFVGNFFSITTPSGFNDGAIHSDHSYATGMGLDTTSYFSYLLKKPITISQSNSIIYFKEIVLVEGHSSGAVFGTEAFTDYVLVEGSTDDGETWKKFEDGYDAEGDSQWVSAVNNNSSGSPSLFRAQTINMTASGDFKAGDNVLIRFRLFSNATINSWGWAIDDLYIQNTITAVESLPEPVVSVYPNPAHGNLTVEAEGAGDEFTIELISAQGQKIYQATEAAQSGKMIHTIASQGFPAGMYVVKISNGSKSTVRKVIKQN